MERWNLAVVVGVPGVGKTSLCRRVSPSMGYHYINYGELMLEIARKLQVASTQDEMFKLTLDLQYKIWRKAAEHIKDQKEVLLDLHGLDKSQKGYLISLPLEVLKPQIIILVETTYENVVKHRIYDKYRVRPVETYKNLKEEMRLLRTSMILCSAMIGSYFVILKNNEFKESLNELENHLKINI